MAKPKKQIIPVAPGLEQETVMAKDTEVKSEAKQEVPAMTQEQLLQVIKAMTESQNAQVRDLAEAIIESKKPYVDPKQEENTRIAREQMRDQMRREKENAKATQAVCPHVQGQLGDSPSHNKSSFALHRLDTGAIVGICTACQKIICSLNPEDQKYFQMAKGGNRMSGAGVRTFADPMKAQKDGWLGE